MDNKKAINLLSMIEFKHAECCLNTWYKGIDDDMKEALEMAIKALEQQPCEDVISRQVLKDLGAECIAKRDENGNLIPLGSIDSLPSVSVTSEHDPVICPSTGVDCEDCPAYEDVISRRAAIDAVCESWRPTDMIKKIKQLPSVSISEREQCEERKKGECLYYAGY